MAETLRLDAGSPWPGLASFNEGDRNYFRGREAESDELARLVRRERLTVLFGRSGLGKSSLLNAGLFPRLREDAHLPVLVRIGYGEAVSPRQQIWEALAAACAAEGIEAAAPTADESLWAYFHRAGGGFWNRRRRPVLPVLVFDQFEELFTLGQAGEAARAAAQGFVAELADLVEDRPSDALRRAIDADPARGEGLDFERRGCKVVLSFREDFLAEIEGLRRRMPSLMRNRFRLLPMSAVQARAVIASGGSLVGTDVAERILGLAWRNRAEAPAPEENDAIEVDPALLSVICSELNLRRRSAGAATITPVLLAGAETEILAEFYERSLRGLDPRVRGFVEDELITAAGYRDSFAFDDALARPGVSVAALQSLVAGRLLRLDERFGVRRLELTHDVLTRVVKDSRDARRAREAEAAAISREQDAALRQQRARRRERVVWAAGVAATALLAGALWAGNWAVRRDKAAKAIEKAASAAIARLTEASSQAEARAEQQAASASQAFAAAEAASAAAQAANAAAHMQTLRANQTERNALATDLIVSARSAPVEELPLRLLLGAEAVKRYPERLDAQVEQLARLVAVRRVRRSVEMDAPIVASTAVGDGARVLVATETGELALIDAVSAEVVGRWQLARGEVGITRLRTSADGRVALADLGNQTNLLRLVPGEPLRAQRVGNVRGGVRIALAPDGRWLADASGGSELAIHALESGTLTAPPRRIALSQPNKPWRCVAFDASSGRLRLGSDATETWTVEPASGAAERAALPARAIAYSADCTKVLVQSDADGGGPRFSLANASGAPLDAVNKSLANPPRAFIGAPAFVAGDNYIAARFADGVQYWPLGGGSPQAWAPEAAPRSVAASADGRWFAARMSGGEIELSRREPESRARFTLPQAPAALWFKDDGSTLVAVGEGRLVQIVRLEDRRALKVGEALFHADQIEFSADGSHLGASSGAELRMFEAKEGHQLELGATWTTIEFSPAAAAPNSDDRALIAAYDGKGAVRVSVFDLGAKMRQVADIELAGDTDLSTLTFDTRGQRLGIAVKGAIVIRDLRAAGPALRLPIETTALKLAFPPRDAIIAAVLDDGSVRAYGLADKRERWRISPVAGRDGENAVAVAYTPDGRSLVVGRRDGALALHDPRNGALQVPLVPPRKSAGEATNLVFIEGTNIVAAGGLNDAKDFWDIAAGRWLGLVGSDLDRSAPMGDLQAVAVSSRGRRVALKHADGTVTLRGWDPPTLVRDACTTAGRNLRCDEWRRFVRDEVYRKTCDALPAPVPACRP